MPGMQSNSTPDPQGANAASIGPLEAARRFRERQRSTEATLAAMDEDESDGRPAWLRRWPSEARREIAPRRFEAAPAPAFRDESSASDAWTGATFTEAADYSGSSNGYSGRSIEAAFSFETVYRFETEFEAKSTADWLRLPEVGEEGSGKRIAEEIDDASLMGRVSEQSMQGEEGDLNPETEEVSGDQTRLDPQAVRAAIFRLAQESSAGLHAGLHAGVPVEGDPVAEAVSCSSAELELELAGDPPTSRRGTHDLLAQAENDPGPLPGSSWKNATEPFECPTSGDSNVARGVSTTRGVLDVSTDAVGATSLSQHQTADVVGNPNGAGQSAPPSRERESAAFSSDASVDEMEIAGVDAGQRPAPVEVDRKAADAPALAHDAGNLLSALNLYSELLALTGVLHARHQHYAQDLKLLAARSEVLIGRLLALCNVTGSNRNDLPSSATADSAMPAGDAAQEYRSAEEGLAEILGETSGNDPGVLPGWHAAQTACEDAPARQAERTTDQIVRPPDGTFLASEIAEEGGQQTTISSPAEIYQTLGGEPAPLNLVDLLTRWQSLLSMIGRGTVEVNFGPNATLPIKVKEEVMERILVNLVHNSMKATRNGGAIRIGVGRIERRSSEDSMPSSDGRAKPGSRMVLTVDDSGCGMTEEQVARILSSPHQDDLAGAGVAADGARRGLGLQIVRELIATSGGRMVIYSRRGSGTRVEMEWPTVEESIPLTRLPPASVGTHGEALRTKPGPGRSMGQSAEAAIFPAYPPRQPREVEANGVEGAIAC